MPELPEVQTVINYLRPLLVGKTIQKIYNPNGYDKVLHNGNLNSYGSFLKKKKIKDVTRRGKYIIINLDTGYLIIHLRMTGKLQISTPNKKNMKYVSFQISFNDKTQLFFEDVRKFGRVYFSNNLQWLENKLGIEPLSKQFTSTLLFNILKKYKRMIKPFLLDQKFVAGLGNIYVDEALWHSRIHPKSITNTISKEKINSLTNAIRNILNKAITYQGTTIINFSYGQNNNGNFSDELQIFGQVGKDCPRCNDVIKKIFVSQRGTHYCNKCQKY